MTQNKHLHSHTTPQIKTGGKDKTSKKPKTIASFQGEQNIHIKVVSYRSPLNRLEIFFVCTLTS